MKKNQRGGILTKMIIIPAGVVLVVGVFFLGYFTGAYRNKPAVSGQIAPPLPELASSAGRTAEEFTFYKTLTDKNEKTVSIDIRPKASNNESKPDQQQVARESDKTNHVQAELKAKGMNSISEKEPSSSEKSRQAASPQPQLPAEKGPPGASLSLKLRYALQTASYQEKGMAEEEVKHLKRKGYAAFVAASELPGKGTWHRVRLGSFSSRAAAEKLQKTLHAKEGISAIIVIE
jgi:cell division septation protein DedD